MAYPIPIMTPLGLGDSDDPFTWDFSNVLADDETITDVGEIVASEEGLTIGNGSVVNGDAGSGKAVQATLDAGTDGVFYVVTANITTSTSRKLGRSFKVLVCLR